MDHYCDTPGCYDAPRFLITTAAEHFKVCAYCIGHQMEHKGIVSAFIIDLKKVQG